MFMNMFKPTDATSVKDYLNKIDEPRKSEVKKVHEFIRKTLPKMKPELYGSIIGYGRYKYKSKSSEGEWFTVGLASQKNYISVYVCSTTKDKHEYLAEKHKSWFPKASIGKSCIRFKKFDDIDFKKLEKILLMAKDMGPMNEA